MRECYGVPAGPPERDAAVPSILLELADGRDVRTAWVNQLGGVTFQLSGHSEWFRRSSASVRMMPAHGLPRLVCMVRTQCPP
jgi:hypothetical protein